MAHFSTDEINKIVLENEKLKKENEKLKKENERLKIKNDTLKEIITGFKVKNKLDEKKVKKKSIKPKVIKQYQISEDYRNFIVKNVTNINKLTDPTTGFEFKQTIFNGDDIMYFNREYMKENLVVTTEEIKEKYKLKHRFRILKEDSEFYNLFDSNTKKPFQFGLDMGYIFKKLKELNHIVEVIEDY